MREADPPSAIRQHESPSPLSPEPPSADSIRVQLEKILTSPGFAHAERKSRFLRFTVESSLAGHADQIKEYLVGMEVFDREASYNPQIDPIVRVEAGRVRLKLKEYYETEGRQDPVLIEFPKGSYVPVFKTRDATLHAKPQGPTSIEDETGATPFPIGGVGRELYDFGPFRLDIAERVLTKGRQAIPITPKAFDTLVVLVRNTGRVVEKDQLLKLVWPDAFVEEGVLAVNIAAIRKAFIDSGDGQSYIETVPRRGYRFIGHIRAGSEVSAEGVLAKVSKHYAKTPIRAIALGLTMLVLFVLAWYVAQLPSNLPFPPVRVVPLTSYPGTEVSPSFSPDASQVAFSWNGYERDNFDIYLKLVDGGDPVRLTHDPALDMSPAWSPDGRQIAFLRGGSVFLIDPLGRVERKLADVQASRIAWTPDGQSLVANCGPRGETRIQLISAESGEMLRNLTSTPAGQFSFGDIGFAVSPDGLNLAFARFPDSTVSRLFLVPMGGGEPTPFTEAGPAIWGLAWTADGKELVYSTGGLSTSATLWRRRIGLPFGTRSARVDIVPEGAVNPVLTQGLRGAPGRLAYERTEIDTNIWAMEVGATGSRKRIIYSTRREGDVQFSPDGQRLAFSSNRSGVRQIYVSGSDGSNQVQLTFFKPGQLGIDSQRTVFANAPRWSPDGRNIVFAATIDNNRDLYVISPEGGSPRHLTTESFLEGRPSWSRDGRWVYFYSTRSGEMDIWKMPAEGGAALQVTTGGGHESMESPDGKVLFYQYGDRANPDRPSVLRSVETGEPRPKRGVLLPPPIQQSWWAVCDKGIYYVDFDERGSFPWRAGGPNAIFTTWAAGLDKVSLPVKFYDFASQRTMQIGAIEKEVDGNYPGFTATRDCQRIAWAQIDRMDTDLMMIENFQ